MMKFDALSVLSNDYMKEQIAGDKLCKLVSKRKKLPHRALDMWKYNMMHQKDIFSDLWYTECVLTYITPTRLSSLGFFKKLMLRFLKKLLLLI
ncbi:hypothetical protein BRADI_1g65452v3 [Brachypodium distachyon]|uniref:Uncharacterized protein n=1 Tax=Brachypodium distachyon TaxID=15368 RepID=A0A2K2DTI8_BRADI|nr:hypothetical protein BRADI_1g65452v3 [Brachypodium distachyon]